MIESKLKANNCNRGQSTVAIAGFQFGLYHVVAPLTFSLSISLASLFAKYQGRKSAILDF